MNLGGEPERDDFGLPPVDIEIPDDARELDRDVQAYRREQRALRRRQRRMRLHGPLTRDGVVLPVLASCLVLALIAGTLLTVFTVGPGTGKLPNTTQPRTTASTSGGRAGHPFAGSGSSATASPAGSPTAVAAGKLPGGAIEVGGRRVPLAGLAAVVVALIPSGCAAGGCAAAVRQLASQASAARVQIYLVGEAGQLATVRRLAARVPGQAAVAADVSGVLRKAYRPAGLTALLVDSRGDTSVARSLAPGFSLTSQLRALGSRAAGGGATRPAPAARASASATASAG